MPLPPGLNRAITDSTSPFGAYPPAEVLRNLEVYFADPRSTDAVYEGLVNRACAEPLSVPLVEKVVALLKAYLLKYTPSQDVVHGLSDFSSRVYELPGLSPTGRKAVAYVRSCLRQLVGERSNGARQYRSNSNPLGSASNGRSREDLSRLASNGLTADGRVTAVKVSVSSSTLGRTNDRYAAADALPSPSDGDLAAQGHLLAWLRQPDVRSPLGYQDLRVPQAGSRTEPPWAVPARPLQLPPAPPGVTAARARSWLQHLPDLAPRVTMAGLEGPASGAAGAPVAAALSLSGAPPISLATIHRCVLDLEEQDIGRHIAEVLGEARAEAQQMQPASPQRRPRARGAAHGGGGGAGRDGMGARRSRPPRLLFHHPPYNRSEQLPMSEADVSVVVEAVCGVRAASALAAVLGPPSEREAAEAAGHAEGMWQAAFEEDGDFGQICGGILMKLLLDMWARSEPQDFFIVVLRMLCRALRSCQPSTRARAFDVLYNLYVHGAMLRSEAEEAALAAAAVETQHNGAGRGAGGVQMPWQVCASAPVSPFISGGGGALGGHMPPPPPRGGAPPSTPAAASTAEPQTPAPAAPPAAAPGAGPKSVHPQLASHSLGLQGSALLDSAGELNGGPPTRGPVGSVGATARPHHARRDTLEVVRLPPPPPSTVTSPGTQAAVLGGAASGAAAAGRRTDAAAGYDRWLRALLFRLLFELQQTVEAAEEVWRAAMGCLAQLCSHGGYWVAAWVQPLPPSALSGLLQAACKFNWSQELYAQLLKLVPCVLARPPDAAAPPPPVVAGAPSPSSRPLDSAFSAPSALRSAVAAAADDAAAAAAMHGAGETEEMRRRLADFGGMDELLFHFARAPTPDARASLMTALVQCCVEAPGGSGAASASVAGSAEQLQLHGARSPRSSGSPGSRAAMEGGPGGVLAVFQGLHLDSVCLALRAALQRPWQGMSSRLADVLASANLDTPGPPPVAAHTHPLSPSASASVSGSAEYALAAMPTLPAGVASPIAVRALLRPLLESLEACCAESMTIPQAVELRAHIDVSVAHIAGSSPAADGASPPPVTAASVAASWRVFKDVCSQKACESRSAAVQWLHKLLSAACRACQGQILLLSPLTLKTSPEASRIAAATAPPSASAGPGTNPNSSSARVLWNTALADALLHVVREAPMGCELLMEAISRTAADLKAAAGPPGLAGGDGALSPRLAAASATPHAAAAAAAAAAGGVTAEEAALVACRRVMVLYYVGLQWMLQCSSAEARMPTVVNLADAVLAALLQPDPAAAAAAGPSADKAPPTSGGGARVAIRAPGGSGPPPPLVLPAAGSQPPPPPPSSTQELGGGMLISQQLLAGLLALDPDALTCTPPELLVTLLQQCSQSLHDAGPRPGATWSNGDARERDSGEAAAAAAASGRAGGEAGFRSMHRGFLGRPCAVVGVAAATGASDGGAGRASTASLRASGGGSGAGDGGLSGAAVGPWRDDWQDRRLALLLLLIARCSLDPEAFAKYSLSHVIKAQLGCDDLRCRYYAGVYLLKHWMLNQHDKYWRTLRHIIGTAQQLNDERLLDNPYLQMRTMLNVDHA